MSSHFEGKTWIFDIFSLISGNFLITFAVSIRKKNIHVMLHMQEITL